MYRVAQVLGRLGTRQWLWRAARGRVASRADRVASRRETALLLLLLLLLLLAQGEQVQVIRSNKWLGWAGLG